MTRNPFILEPYRSKAYFCDRESETQEILSGLENGRNITLISPRRLGKTGLIYRVFDEIQASGRNWLTIHVDISSSQDLEDFIHLLAEAVASRLEKKSRIQTFLRTLGGIRPLISYDPLNGQPQVSLTYRSEDEKRWTLKSLLGYLDNLGEPVVVAIDEFQQIREYPDTPMEALLRTYIQPLRNIRFIFCGSKKHLMVEMFTDARRPFYESTAFLFLKKLDPEVYAGFIRRMFAMGSMEIRDEETRFILEWTRGHTFYTQMLCNTLYMQARHKVIRQEDVAWAASSILVSERDRFLEIQRLVTPAQWKMLRAIAREGSVSAPTAAAFLKKHGISSGATALRNLTALVDKELLLAEPDGSRTTYRVYNVFLSRFLESL